MQINMQKQELNLNSDLDDESREAAGCRNCCLASVKGACDDCLDCRELTGRSKPKRPKRSLWQ